MFTVSDKILTELYRIQRRFCAPGSDVPCISFGQETTGGVVRPPEFFLGAIKRLPTPGLRPHKLITLGGLEVALIVPDEFDLLEDMHLDVVDGRIVNVL